MATAETMMMIAETSFMAMEPKQSISLQLLKVEAIDRLYAVVDSLPKYKQKLDEVHKIISNTNTRLVSKQNEMKCKQISKPKINILKKKINNWKNVCLL